MSRSDSYAPYAERPLVADGVLEHAGYRLRRWEVVYGGGAIDHDRFAPGIDRALAQLPRPAVSGGRPGVGFLIAHQGATADYLVLCWWDNENELPTRVLVRDDEGWRDARGRESFCVWDLEIMWRERQRYVDTVLDGGALGGGIEEYLSGG